MVSRLFFGYALAELAVAVALGTVLAVVPALAAPRPTTSMVRSAMLRMSTRVAQPLRPGA
jgi:hypothetical protein